MVMVRPMEAAAVGAAGPWPWPRCVAPLPTTPPNHPEQQQIKTDNRRQTLEPSHIASLQCANVVAALPPPPL